MWGWRARRQRKRRSEPCPSSPAFSQWRRGELQVSKPCAKTIMGKTIQHKQYGHSGETHASVSESSVTRLLATLLCSPSDSSLWNRSIELPTTGSGGTWSVVSPSCERSSWAADFLRCRLLLKSLDILRRVLSSPWPTSSELLRYNLSRAPSMEDLMLVDPSGA